MVALKTKAAPAVILVLGLALPFAGCGSDTSSGTGGDGGDGGSGGAGATGGGTTTSTGGSSQGGGGATSSCGADVPPTGEVVPGTTDPEAGDFTMDEALAELPEGPGPLRAIITTTVGVITCELRPDKAPIGVANFVGLARGRRAWKDPVTKQWVKRKLYDGTIFHRIIDDFVAQGGDPLGTGFGGPGYQFVNEISDLLHEPGTLAYANAGPDTNGSQFYITEVKLPNLDGGYTVFGACGPMDVIQTLTAVPTNANDKPLTDVTMTIEITRCAP